MKIPLHQINNRSVDHMGPTLLPMREEMKTLPRLDIYESIGIVIVCFHCTKKLQ